MPTYLWIALGTILAIGGVALYVAGHAAAAIVMIVASGVCDVLFVLALLDRRRRERPRTSDR